jgi:hypothetical protein
MRFAGYSLTQKGYRLYDENKRKIFIRRDVTFNETDFGHTNRVQLEVEEEDDECSKEESDKKSPDSRCSAQERKPPVYYHDEYAGITTAKHTALFVTEVEEPTTLKKALKSHHAENWKTAADSEYQSLMENETWKLVELPPGRKAITCSRWVFKVKHDENGKIDRFKGRLVAKSFLQKCGIEFDETFSPVVHFTSIRALLAFAVSRNMFIHQMDVVTAFLNGTLDEDIYMEQPEGYVVPGK